MKGTSKVIMGATLSMVVVLVFVLALLLVLLAELYCSLLLRRRKLKASKPSENVSGVSTTAEQVVGVLGPSPLSSFYAQGVLDAPRSCLFPKLPSGRENRVVLEDDVEKGVVQHHGKLHEFLRVHSPQQLGLASSLSSPSPSYISLFRPQPTPEIEPEPKPKPKPEPEPEPELGCGCKRENLMYISNPIYDNEAANMSRGDTPFETPGSSPSRMDQNGSGSGLSGDEKEMGNPSSLPLTPMKDLTTNKACALGLRGASSLGNSISDSNTHSHVDRSSSSSSETPCTSPSW